jgi:hypothetical protein
MTIIVDMLGTVMFFLIMIIGTIIVLWITFKTVFPSPRETESERNMKEWIKKLDERKRKEL